MVYIKRLVIQGFKSFSKKTEIVFDKGINVIVGPNGSGKSNISDALCFVLGRLSVKSMRAAKAKNLLFMGTSTVKPAKEAWVELVFDNTDRTFGLDNSEVSLKRIVRQNGQSMYKINDQARTRAEVIEVLAQAGIDPYGFNLILQGQIQSIVRMHQDERRKIIEEVAGISIYESRKEKSLKELEKTEERLREISAVLRERNAYLKNLESERSQALKFKELESTVKRCKASILTKKIEAKVKELDSVRKSIEVKSKQKEEIRHKSEEVRLQIESANERITQINKHIQKSTGFEQESLHDAIANLKAELEGLRVRKESYEHRKSEIERRINEIKSSIPEHEAEILELRKKSPLMAKKQEELKKKKEELTKIEEERKQLYMVKNNLMSIKDRLKEKESSLHKVSVQSDSLMKQIEDQSFIFKHKTLQLCDKHLTTIKKKISEARVSLESLRDSEMQFAKEISSAESVIKSSEKIKEDVTKIDLCPLCQNQMTPEHLSHVNEDCDKKIAEAWKTIKGHANKLEDIKSKRAGLTEAIKGIEKEISETERESSGHKMVTEKQSYLKRLVEEEKVIKQELQELAGKRDSLEKNAMDSARIEENYRTKIMEIEEISSRTEKDLDTTLSYRERDLEKMKEVIKIGSKDIEEIAANITEINETLTSKTQALAKKEKEEEELNEKFKKMFEERDKLQENVQKISYELSTLQSEVRQIEDQINFLKVGNAKLDAEREAIEMELTEFSDAEIIKASREVLEEKLRKAQDSLRTIGSINMRALEVYEEIKTEYDKIKEKADIIEKEKEEIMKIIADIDNKKKKTFMKAFNSVNALFSENFSRLYTKGRAFLEIENKEDIFSGGIKIVIRLAKGKYFDVTSLSGGEQTMIALSLLFAIQEYAPYHFYVFDEIDAALDKRNSERLSALLKKYMGHGQYIIITHNDAIILESNVLYGVSMHDGVSKILSLKIA